MSNEEIQRDNLTTYSIIDIIELPVESNISNMEVAEMTVVDHVAVELLIPSKPCSGSEEPQLTAEVMITPGSLDSSACSSWESTFYGNSFGLRYFVANQLLYN